jgi:hypothetical protein
MGIHLGKFIHTKTGKIVMSMLLGFGLASLFRVVCKNKECMIFSAPPLDTIQDNIYKTTNGKCVKYNKVGTKCDSTKKIINFA